MNLSPGGTLHQLSSASWDVMASKRYGHFIDPVKNPAGLGLP